MATSGVGLAGLSSTTHFVLCAYLSLVTAVVRSITNSVTNMLDRPLHVIHISSWRDGWLAGWLQSMMLPSSVPVVIHSSAAGWLALGHVIYWLIKLRRSLADIDRNPANISDYVHSTRSFACPDQYRKVHVEGDAALVVVVVDRSIARRSEILLT